LASQSLRQTSGPYQICSLRIGIYEMCSAESSNSIIWFSWSAFCMVSCLRRFCLMPLSSFPQFTHPLPRHSTRDSCPLARCQSVADGITAGERETHCSDQDWV
jgi:hypothetical protein